MDELELLGLNKGETLEDHNYLLEKANLITVSATKLHQGIPSEHLYKTILLKNAVDDYFINEIKKDYKVPNEIRLLKNNYTKIVGYYGAIAPWVDFDLIEYSLKKLPQFAFIFIGPIFEMEEKVNFLKDNYDNIYFIKEMDRKYLISYLQSFDMCIIPFIKNNITDSVSPVKIYEYIVANKPVITTNILECQDMNIVDVVDAQDEFIKKLISPKKITNGISSKFIKNNRWANRVDGIIKYMNKEIK
jgi:hypothetical protein